MKIKEFISGVQKQGCDVRIDGSRLTIHRKIIHYVDVDPWSDREKKIELAPPFLVCNMISSRFDTALHLQYAQDLGFEKINAVLSLVKAVVDTSLKDRFGEKVWMLRWVHRLGGGYLRQENPGVWTMVGNSDQASLFPDSELKKLKEDNPKLAPAITAMKELVID